MICFDNRGSKGKAFIFIWLFILFHVSRFKPYAFLLQCAEMTSPSRNKNIIPADIPKQMLSANSQQMTELAVLRNGKLT